jgi:hypothetical protein
MRTPDEIIQHVKSGNSKRVGRPYSIKRLVFVFGIRPSKPKRLTDWMRLELDEKLRQAGIGNDRILQEQYQDTKLYPVPGNQCENQIAEAV